MSIKCFPPSKSHFPLFSDRFFSRRHIFSATIIIIGLTSLWYQCSSHWFLFCLLVLGKLMCHAQALILVRVLGPWPRPTCEPSSVSLPSACYHLHLSSPITDSCKCHRMHSLSRFDLCFTNTTYTWYRIVSTSFTSIDFLLFWISSWMCEPVHCTDMVGERPLLTSCKHIDLLHYCNLFITNFESLFLF